jgi:Tfp pilus assembly protein PilN
MPQEQINLLPESEVRQVKVNPYVNWFFRIGVYFLMFTYAIMLGAYGFRWYQESFLNGLNTSIENNKKQYQDSLTFLKEYKSVQDRYGLVAGVMTDYRPKLKLLQLIEESVPEPIRIKEMDINTGNGAKLIVLTGISSDYLAIRQWQDDLSKNEMVSNVDLQTIERVTEDPNGAEIAGGGQIEFSFNIVYK